MNYNRRNETRLVYTTDRSDACCAECGEIIDLCRCNEKAAIQIASSEVCLRREKKGRRGKTVTTLSGLAHSAQELKVLAADLKRHCGTGGSVKEGIIIIQGDHRQKIAEKLTKMGCKTKFVGG